MPGLILVWNRRHLERILNVYVDHYNVGRPHRGIDLNTRSVLVFGKLRDETSFLRATGDRR